MPFRGRALWKFNNSLFEDQFFCTNMALFINDLLVLRLLLSELFLSSKASTLIILLYL